MAAAVALYGSARNGSSESQSTGWASNPPAPGSYWRVVLDVEMETARGSEKQPSKAQKEGRQCEACDPPPFVVRHIPITKPPPHDDPPPPTSSNMQIKSPTPIQHPELATTLRYGSTTDLTITGGDYATPLASPLPVERPRSPRLTLYSSSSASMQFTPSEPGRSRSRSVGRPASPSSNRPLSSSDSSSGFYRGRAASPLLRKVISNGVPASPTGTGTSARLSIEIPTASSSRQGHVLRTFPNNILIARTESSKSNSNIDSGSSNNNNNNTSNLNKSSNSNLQVVLPVDRPPHESEERHQFWTSRGRSFEPLAPSVVRHFYTEAEGVLIGQACVRVKHDIAPQVTTE
jgi:hypothetical protein